MDNNEVNEAILGLFSSELEEKCYLYLSVMGVDFEKRLSKSLAADPNQTNYKTVEDYFISHKLYIKTSYRKRQKAVLDVLRSHFAGTVVHDNMIYYKDKIDLKIINSVNSLLNFLKDGNIKIDEDVFYRGQSSFQWNLVPSLYREKKWVENEKLMMDKMMQSNPDEFTYTTTFDVLSKLQHYNLPTRLIDVTINPLVALFFSCNGKETQNEDGQLFIFTPAKEKVKFVDSDTVSVLANISKMEISFGNYDVKNPDNGDVLRLIHFIRKEKPYFENYLEDGCLNNYVFVYANYNNKRIAKQNGAFILVGIQDTKEKSTKISEYIMSGSKKTLFLIPRGKKNSIINELKLLSIHEGTMFPEIDNMAKYVKETL